jgi:5'-nucleotidase/2' 3'-cyclic phosphodiesterase and related esterases-like protein
MKSSKIKIAPLVLVVVLLLSLFSGCALNNQDDIVILYTNDVHCAVDADIGYAGLAAYKNWIEQKTDYVTLVDCGDALQGDAIGTVSKGEYLVDIMNYIGYDFAVLGNHEFDYGMQQLSELMAKSSAQYLGCNINYTGSGESAVSALKAYEIVEYGKVKVAFIGVLTPESIVKSTPSYFMDESGQLVYDFYGNSGEQLYTQVQKTVDECRDQGADFVVALAHLGNDEQSEPFSSVDLIKSTSGIDVVLDGHSHSVIPCDVVIDKDGNKVLLSSTGTGLTNIGQLVITPSGNISTGLIGDYPDSESKTETFIKEIQSQYESDLNRVVAQTEVKLTTTSDSAVRLIRNRETNLGDFCADAYRYIAEADIGFANGGGIRADIDAGDITYGDIISVHPYGNTLCVAEVTGQEILDALEMASRSVLLETSDRENAVGENGGFLQVSGLKYTVDTSIESTVQVDESGMFLSCGENRRVKDVMVLGDDGEYVPLDPQKTYTLASHNYLIKQGGDGINMFMDNKLILNEGMLDYQVLITYITENLDGIVGEEYSTAQGRIIIE